MTVDFEQIRETAEAKIQELLDSVPDDARNEWSEFAALANRQTLDVALFCLREYHEMLLQSMQK